MKFLGKIWAVWGTVVFASFMFLALPIYVVGILIWGKRAIQKVHFISRAWAGFIFLMCGIRIKRSGQFPSRKQPMVLISNHLSALDIPLCAVMTGNPFKFLAKAELGKIPVLGWIIKNIYITVDRSSKAARVKSLETMKREVQEGTSVFIYPEGTRNKTAEPLRNFHEGAFKLAIEAQVPIGILRIGRTRELCPPSGFWLSSGVLEGEWVDIVDTKGLTTNDSKELTSRCKQILLDSIKENA